MYIAFCNPVLSGCTEQPLQVGNMAVNPSVAQESQKVNGFLVFTGIGKGLLQYSMFPELILLDRQVYLSQILIYDTAGTQIHMSDFGISHLSFREPHIHSVGQQGGMGVVLIKGIDKRGIRLGYGGNTRIRGNSPSIQDHQDNLFIHQILFSLPKIEGNARFCYNLR